MLLLVAGELPEPLQHLVHRHAGNEDGPRPVVDLAVRHVDFRSARRRPIDACHGNRAAARPAPPVRLAETVEGEERRARRCGAVVARIGRTLVDSPGLDRCRLELRAVGGGGVRRHRVEHHHGDGGATAATRRKTSHSLAPKLASEQIRIETMFAASVSMPRVPANTRISTRLPATEIEPVRELEAAQAPIDVPPGRRPAIAPGPPFVPAEIVQHRGFDGDHRRPEIVQRGQPRQHAQHGELQPGAERADAVESEPAVEAAGVLHASEGVNGRRIGSAALAQLHFLERFRPVTAEQARQRPIGEQPALRSGTGRSSWLRCARRRSAARDRRRPGRVCRTCRGPPSPAGTR